MQIYIFYLKSIYSVIENENNIFVNKLFFIFCVINMVFYVFFQLLTKRRLLKISKTFCKYLIIFCNPYCLAITKSTHVGKTNKYSWINWIIWISSSLLLFFWIFNISCIIFSRYSFFVKNRVSSFSTNRLFRIKITLP